MYELEIQISEDAQNWESITTVSTILDEEWSSFTIGRRATFVRIVFISNSTPTSDWVGLWQVYILGN